MKWEYKVEIQATSNLSELDKLGEEGWELVSVVLAAHTFIYYFKRPIKDDRIVTQT